MAQCGSKRARDARELQRNWRRTCEWRSFGTVSAERRFLVRHPHMHTRARFQRALLVSRAAQSIIFRDGPKVEILVQRFRSLNTVNCNLQAATANSSVWARASPTLSQSSPLAVGPTRRLITLRWEKLIMQISARSEDETFFLRPDCSQCNEAG